MDILNFYKALFGKCYDCKLGITTINKDSVIFHSY